MNAYLLIALCGTFAAVVSANDLQDQIDRFAEDLHRVKEEIARLKNRIEATRVPEDQLPGKSTLGFHNFNSSIWNKLFLEFWFSLNYTLFSFFERKKNR